jgi:hypothetical protein
MADTRVAFHGMTLQLLRRRVPGLIFASNYLIVPSSAGGACGRVYLVMDTLDSDVYALKIT